MIFCLQFYWLLVLRLLDCFKESLAFLKKERRAVGIMLVNSLVGAVGDDALQVRTNALLQDMFPSEQRATLISMESFLFSVIMSL